MCYHSALPFRKLFLNLVYAKTHADMVAHHPPPQISQIYLPVITESSETAENF